MAEISKYASGLYQGLQKIKIRLHKPCLFAKNHKKPCFFQPPCNLFIPHSSFVIRELKLVLSFYLCTPLIL